MIIPAMEYLSTEWTPHWPPPGTRLQACAGVNLLLLAGIALHIAFTAFMAPGQKERKSK